MNRIYKRVASAEIATGLGRLGRSLGIAIIAIGMLMWGAPDVTAQGNAKETAAKLGITTHKLGNGFEIIVVENHGQPLVTVEVAAKNGAYTEPEDYNGLSHLYEHMFFKANAEITTQEKYMERLRELGASWNGTTSDERVNYFMTVHSKNLREGVEFVRDALLYPLFKEDELRREWPVVLGEFDRNEADPGFHLMREMDKLMWHKYFSRKNTIGDRKVIFNATRDQMRTIQKRYYIPNNCALVIAGDADPKDVFELAEEMFGDWERGEDPFKKFPVPEHPPIEKTSRIVVTGPVQTAAVQIGWHGPSLGKDTEATYAADVLSYILGQPDSNFQKALVDTGIVDFIHLSYQTLMHTGPISVAASTTPDRLDQAWKAINDELSKLDDPTYITDEQLQAAKNMIEIEQIYDRERSNNFSHTISYWWCTGGLDYYLTYVDNIKKITRKDMARYVDKYIKDQPRIEGVLVGEGDVEKLEFAKTARVIKPESGTSDVAFARGAKTDNAKVATEEFDVDGLRVVLRSNPVSEICVATAVLYGGLQFYGSEKAGHELLVLETLDKGSKSFSKEDVARQLALTGSSIGGDARYDYSVFNLSTLQRDLDKNFTLFADAFVHPLLTDEELKLAIDRRMTGIKMQKESPDAWISTLSGKNFFKGHPYEAPPSGIEETISGVTPVALRELHENTFVRSRVKLFIVGNVTKEKATELVKAGFADLPAGFYTPKPVLLGADRKPTLLTEKRELPTNYVFGAFSAPNLSSPEYPAFQVAMAILDDRLFEEVRTKRNLSYAVAAQLSNRLSNYGVLYVTATQANRTLEVMFEQADRIIKEPVSAKEVGDKIQEMITGDLIRNQTNASQAAALVTYDAVGTGWPAEAESLAKIQEVTPVQVQEVAAKYLKNFSFAVLGDPERVDEKLFTSK